MHVHTEGGKRFPYLAYTAEIQDRASVTGMDGEHPKGKDGKYYNVVIGNNEISLYNGPGWNIYASVDFFKKEKMINNKFLIFFFLFLLGCQNENFNIPPEIESMNLGELYEELKWEIYSKTYNCTATPLEFNSSKREEVEVYKIDINFSSYSLVNDTLKINYIYIYNDRVFVPNCQDAPFSFIYVLSTKKRIGWESNGIIFRLNESLNIVPPIYPKKEDSMFIEFIKSKKKNINNWAIYYAKKKNYIK